MSRAAQVADGTLTRFPSDAGADNGRPKIIAHIGKFEGDGLRCRKSVAPREGFEGVSLREGTACLQGDGPWPMREFGSADT